MKKITENTLLESIKSLRQQLAIIEGRGTVTPPMDTSSSLPPPNFQNDPMIQHPFSNATKFAQDNNAAILDRMKSAFGGQDAPGGHTSYGHGRGYVPPAEAPTRGGGRGGFTPQGQGTSAKPSAPTLNYDQQSANSADHLLNPPQKFNLFQPQPQRQFNPADTSYAQDHPPVDDLGGPSDLDKAPIGNKTGAAPKGTAAKPTQHPAGQPTVPGAKFDPAVQKLQYELRAKGYPVKADGILGPKTRAALDWESKSSGNTQGDFDRHPEEMDDANNYADLDYQTPDYDDFDDSSDQSMPNIPDDPNRRIAEHVSFKQDESLARIMQIANWR